MRWLWGIAFGLVLLYLLTGVVQVRPGQRAVVRRFGRVLAEKPEPGLCIGLPWGMDRVDIVDVAKVRQVGVGYTEDETGLPSGQFLTGDHNLVNVRVLLYYQVSPEQVADFALESAPRVDAVLERTLESAAAEWVAGRGVDDVLLHGKTAMHNWLKEQIPRRVGSYRLGVEILDARVEQIAPPEEVKDAFDRVSRAQAQMATLRYRAEQEAATRQRLGSADRYRIDQTTKTYVYGVKVMAERDAQRFRDRLRQYQAARGTNPDYLLQIWQEERGRLLQKLRDGGQIDLLDHRLGERGLDLFTGPGKR